MKKRYLTGIVITVLIAGTAVIQYPRLNIISGYAAKNLCSCMYLSGRTKESVIREDNNFPPVRIAKYQTATAGQSVTASVFGMMPRTAVFQEDIGCRLITPEGKLPENPPFPVPHNCPPPAPYPQGNLAPVDTVFAEVDYEALHRSIDRAFAPEHRTRAVVVLYKDHLVAERYAPGFDRETPILGWSMSKSVLATLYGILQKKNLIDLKDSSLFPEWANDKRKSIDLKDLLQMQSGLEWSEDYTKISDVTRMLFLEEDMAEVQRQKKLSYPPGTHWYYSSGTTNLLSGYMRGIFEDYQQYLDFPVVELYDKLGMPTAITEMDLSGNYVYSSYTWMSPRDWAKLGLLYLHEGNWFGEQIIDSTWVSFVSTPNGHSNGRYGAHFWLNAGGLLPDVPVDTYSMDGYQGQRVYIIPSRQTVIVRMGLNEEVDFNALVSGILKAFHE